jgi:uncharacterized membrane protein YciS (DUF1049 family)
MPFTGLSDSLLGLIQAMVTPAVMISACGLLLLALTNRLARIIDRIRSLNAEFRDSDFHEDPTRELSVRNQFEQLVRRAVYVRNACGLLILAVTVFVATSLCVGLTHFGRAFEVLMLVLFVAGLVIVAWAGALAYLEMRISHRVVIEELKEFRLRD